MNAVAAPIERLRASASTRQRVAAGLLGLLVVSFLLRSTAIHARYWIDEALAIGFARHPLADIPGLLRQDGSPPLYYLLLGVWIRIVGDGEARTHALSLGFALLAIPAAWAMARALFSERAAWLSALFAAVLPFLSYYAQETRMYTLLVLLSMLTMGAWALAFVRGRRGWLWGFALAGTALAYTHNWGLFMLAGSGLALLPRLRSREVAWRDVLLGYGAIALLYAPWVPSLLFQAGHTGAPWSRVPSPGGLPGDLADMADGEGAAVALLLAGGVGLAALRRRARRPGGDSRAATAEALGLALLLALAVAFVVNQAAPGWTLRYFAVLVGPAILLGGALLANAGRLGLVAAALVTALWFYPPTHALNNKSDVHHVAYLVGDELRPGDLVVSAQPEQLPVMHFYFPAGLRWADGMGYVKDPTIMDWRDVLERYRHTWPRPTARRLLATMRPGQQLVLAVPILRTGSWKAPWTKLVRKRSVRWEQVLDQHPLLQREHVVPEFGHGRVPRGIRLILYRRVAR